MELLKGQSRLRKTCILKAKLWFGSDTLKEVFKEYDYYLDDDNLLLYVYLKEVSKC